MVDFLAIQTKTGWGQTLRVFADWCAPQPGWRVLDIGCGPGFFPALLARRGCRALGVDLDAALLLKDRLHPTLAQANAVYLPFPPASFDLVTASNVLFMLPDPEQALKEMRRILRPSGIAAVLNPSEHMSLPAARQLIEERGLEGAARESLLHWAERAERHARWSAYDLETLFDRAGLSLSETILKVGPGLARFAKGVVAHAS